MLEYLLHGFPTTPQCLMSICGTCLLEPAVNILAIRICIIDITMLIVNKPMKWVCVDACVRGCAWGVWVRVCATKWKVCWRLAW